MGPTKKLKKGTMLTDTYSDVTELDPKQNQLISTHKKWYNAVNTARTNASKKGITLNCTRVDHRTPPLQLGSTGLTIRFLAPINFGSAKSPRLKYGDAGETINGNSVCIMLEYGKARILLYSNLNNLAEGHVRNRWRIKDLRAHVFKANHHGSQHFTPEFLNTVKPWVSVVSSGDMPDYGHPRANLWEA